MIAPKNSAAAVIKKQGTVPAPAEEQNKILSLLANPEVKARFHEIMADRSMLDRFLGLLNGIARTTPKLLECTEQSVMAAMLKCATLRLEPNDPIRQQCFLIPRWNGKTQKMECSWEIGAKGLIELAYRSDEVESIAVSEIYERDFFDVDWGTNAVTHKLPKTDRFNRGKVEAYWAQWNGKDGSKGRPVIMPMADMLAFMNQYVQSVKDEKTKEYSPWVTAFDQMALKTVIKRCLKTAPLSSEDMRRGLDEGDPQDNPQYQVPLPGSAVPFNLYAAADPMQISPDAFQARTIDAEYENQSAPAAPTPEPEPPAPEPQQNDQVAIDEQHRQEWLKQVIDLVKTKGITNTVLLEKTGMTGSMIQSKATLAELQKFYRALQ